ncbi:MAG: rhodanese-like domain-containing protein [Crocinitomicaceae bacterium]|nr:rhodanese-like domain-containing protein [Crocinitomicaceae bacterium]
MKNLAILFALVFSSTSFAQDSDSPLVSFEDYERLMSEVKEHRKTRLVDLNQFNAMSQKKEVYILDTRSKEMYDRKHVKGAIHLNFADFTQENLDALFPNRNASILIYCNNNFMDDIDLSSITFDPNFASKVSRPVFDLVELEIEPVVSETIQLSDQTETRINSTPETDEEIEMLERTIAVPETAITLALNIPTYINLYGYGYRNVYELSELVSIYDERIQFEGSEVTMTEN